MTCRWCQDSGSLPVGPDDDRYRYCVCPVGRSLQLGDRLVVGALFGITVAVFAGIAYWLLVV